MSTNSGQLDSSANIDSSSCKYFSLGPIAQNRSSATDHSIGDDDVIIEEIIEQTSEPITAANESQSNFSPSYTNIVQKDALDVYQVHSSQTNYTTYYDGLHDFNSTLDVKQTTTNIEAEDSCTQAQSQTNTFYPNWEELFNLWTRLNYQNAAHENAYDDYSHESFLQTTENAPVQKQIQFEPPSLHSKDNTSNCRHEEFALDISHIFQPNITTVPTHSLPIGTSISHLGEEFCDSSVVATGQLPPIGTPPTDTNMSQLTDVSQFSPPTFSIPTDSQNSCHPVTMFDSLMEDPQAQPPSLSSSCEGPCLDTPMWYTPPQTPPHPSSEINALDSQVSFPPDSLYVHGIVHDQ